MMRWQLVSRQGVGFWTIPALTRLGYKNAWFLKTGGVSTGGFASLNLGFSSGDRPERVRKNRELALKSTGFGPGTPVLGQQVHGCRLRVIRKSQHDRGWQEFSTSLQETDGLLTGAAGVPLAVAAADCLPVLIGASGFKAAAALHAGWRGIEQGILLRAILRFKKQWDIPARALWAAVGPGIGAKKFVIRGEVLKVLGERYPGALVGRMPDESAGFDLGLAARLQLQAGGIPAAQVTVCRQCTASLSSRYFSYRRDGKETGRMLGMIQII